MDSSASSYCRLLTSPSMFLLYLVFLSFFPSCSLAAEEDECQAEKRGSCYDESEALRLKIIAIFSILVTSMIGIGLPLFSRSLPLLRPDSNFFVLVKAFASGVILATGYIHLLPESFENLTSPCLPENPWSKFSFTAFIAMVSAIFTLMLDSFMMSFYNKRNRRPRAVEAVELVDESSPNEDGLAKVSHGHGHSQFPTPQTSAGVDDSAVLLSRYRIIAQVLELGIVVHSVVIGLSLGTSQNPCTIRPLIAALCFHQMFEGLGLGGCILQAEYGFRMKAILAFFFSVTTPFGIALGIALTKVYRDNSPTALIVVGVLNASSAGLLNYMALVDLLAVDFMGQKLQSSIRLQAWAYVAVLLGAGGMSLLSKWA